MKMPFLFNDENISKILFKKIKTAVTKLYFAIVLLLLLELYRNREAEKVIKRSCNFVFLIGIYSTTTDYNYYSQQKAKKHTNTEISSGKHSKTAKPSAKVTSQTNKFMET